jgi:hypothetical protein
MSGEQREEHDGPRDGVLRIYPPTDGAHAAALADASRAYARGDFGSARRLARAALAAEPSVEERAFADEVLRRTAFDPVALAVGLGCFALFWLVIYLTVWR